MNLPLKKPVSITELLAILKRGDSLESKEEISEAARKRLIQCLENGQVVFPEGTEESLANLGRISKNDPDYGKITNVKLSCWGDPEGSPSCGFNIEWQSHGFGFGNITVGLGPDGVIRCDNETMSAKFVKSVMCALVDNMVMID